MAFERLENKRYPSLCAHRGLSGLCPEGTLPAFGAAIAMGAREIEFDLRLTRDQQLVISHDPDLSRIAGRKGMVEDCTLEELKGMNIGVHQGWKVGFWHPGRGDGGLCRQSDHEYPCQGGWAGRKAV